MSRAGTCNAGQAAAAATAEASVLAVIKAAYPAGETKVRGALRLNACCAAAGQVLAC
jgi:hypothetical protein